MDGALEGTCSQIGDLHLRNGLYGFADRMDAQHFKMEEVLDLTIPANGILTPVVEAAAVLDWHAADIAAYPAPEAADPAYLGLAKAVQDSMKVQQDAAPNGDALAFKAAIGALTPPVPSSWSNSAEPALLQRTSGRQSLAVGGWYGKVPQERGLVVPLPHVAACSRQTRRRVIWRVQTADRSRRG